MEQFLNTQPGDNNRTSMDEVREALDPNGGLFGRFGVLRFLGELFNGGTDIADMFDPSSQEYVNPDEDSRREY